MPGPFYFGVVPERSKLRFSNPRSGYEEKQKVSKLRRKFEKRRRKLEKQLAKITRKLGKLLAKARPAAAKPKQKARKAKAHGRVKAARKPVVRKPVIVRKPPRRAARAKPKPSMPAPAPAPLVAPDAGIPVSPGPRETT